jgi:hypothetical protein
MSLVEPDADEIVVLLAPRTPAQRLSEERSLYVALLRSFLSTDGRDIVSTPESNAWLLPEELS